MWNLLATFFGWLIPKRSEYRADFAAVSDRYEGMCKRLEAQLAAQDARVDAFEGRMKRCEYELRKCRIHCRRCERELAAAYKRAAGNGPEARN